ncbi:hypothetical protein MCOR25_002031 [Pyricularia grisea]|nr:hypothetical protein MCOR25_002031 [Pyricularia grisea]
MGSITLPHATVVDQQASLLTQHLLQNYTPDHGASFLTCSAYDTAWLALVKKRNASGQQQWLFPECFQVIIDKQLENGSWEAHGSRINGILSTASSLLALLRHASEPLQIVRLQTAEVRDRADRATAALQDMLNAWDVRETKQSGYAYIMQALLRYLKDEGIPFEFPGEAISIEEHAAAIASFKPESLEGKQLCYLEAFIGQLDYRKITNRINGGIMGSPSSTAAYLIGLPDSAWDDEAEKYLASTLANMGGKGAPGLFPSTTFEFSQVLSTLLQGGFSEQQLGSSATEVARILDRAPLVTHDVDDMAKTLVVLSKMGIPKSAAGMMEEFQTASNGDSFGTHCNVLLALLHQPNPAEHFDNISKLLRFLCTSCWKSTWSIQDKHNLSPLYPGMLMMQAMIMVVELVETGDLPQSILSDIKTRTEIAIAMFHTVLHTVETQEDGGSWNGLVEATAYAVILLSVACRITLFDPVRQQITEAVRKAEKWLEPKASPTGEHIWVLLGKTIGGSPVVTLANRLAALKSASLLPATSTIGSCLCTPNFACMDPYIKLLRATPMFSTFPDQRLNGAAVEASLFLPMLEKYRNEVFARENVAKDRYFPLIPLTWTVTCALEGLRPSPEFLWEMSKVGVFLLQADEFMEGVVQQEFADDLGQVTRYVRHLIPLEPGDLSTSDAKGPFPGVERLRPLKLMVDFILGHQAVASITPNDRLELARALRSFLITHIQQAEINVRASREGANFTPAMSFYGWVGSVAADHSASPLGFAFIACLLQSTLCPELAGADILPTAEEKYYSTAVSRHSGCMCRVQNDLASVTRDAAEGNWNSVNFPEFDITATETKKKALWELAEFEKSTWLNALAKLEEVSRKRVMNLGESVKKATETRIKCWRMYCNNVELYGQLWIVRDMSSRVMQAAR